MASQFKNRLVGVTILVASVVIFLPSIIDGKKMANEDEVVAIPIKPEIKAHTVVAQQAANKTDAISREQHLVLPAKQPNESPQSADEDDQWEVEEIAQTTTLSSHEVVKESAAIASPKVVKETAAIAAPKVVKETKPLAAPKVAKEKIAVASSKVVQEKVAVAAPKVVKEAKTAVALHKNAWTIQLGAFQNAANINLLLKKLHKAGFQAHTMPSDVIDGQLTRVFVGPNVSKTTLENQLPQLKNLTQLQGKIMPFNAVNP